MDRSLIYYKTVPPLQLYNWLRSRVKCVWYNFQTIVSLSCRLLITIGWDNDDVLALDKQFERDCIMFLTDWYVIPLQHIVITRRSVFTFISLFWAAGITNFIVFLFDLTMRAKTSSLSHPIVINSRHDRAEKITYFWRQSLACSYLTMSTKKNLFRRKCCI
jgi:hypothetical protein